MTYYTIEHKVSPKRWSSGSRYSDKDKALAMARDLDEHGNSVRVLEHTEDNVIVIWKAR